jgi:CHAD domain-containing protein
MATRPTPAAAYPVQSLREQCTALEAAIGLVLAKPRKEPVHRVRTSTRRIEALLELLSTLKSEVRELAGLSKSVSKVKKLLAAVRKAAGRVRDFDVQRAMIKNSVGGAGAGGRARGEAKHLRAHLKHLRAEEAEALIAELEGHARKLGPKLEKLLASLEPAQDMAIAPAHLTFLIRTWYAARTLDAGTSDEALHEIRKSAKLARYMAESAGAVALAAEFEETQQLGGTWHDTLILSQLASDHLGKKSKVYRIVREQEKDALDEFQQHLEAATPAG